MNLIQEFKSEQNLAAIEWGNKNPDLMALKACPFDFFDDDFHIWHTAKLMGKVLKLSPEEQLKKFTALELIAAKMNS